MSANNFSKTAAIFQGLKYGLKADKSADVARAAYGSNTEFGRGLSNDQKLNYFKKITGKDLDLSGLPNYGAQRDQWISDMYDQSLKQALITSDLSDEEAYKHGIEQPGTHWANRFNRITDQNEVIADKNGDDSNFWRKYKKPLIQVGGGVLGFLVGGPSGAVAGANLAGTIRDAYAARVDKRKFKDWQRDWENDPRNKPWEPTPGHVYQSAGEGVVDFQTKDVDKKRKQAYVEKES